MISKEELYSEIQKYEEDKGVIISPMMREDFYQILERISRRKEPAIEKKCNHKFINSGTSQGFAMKKCMQCGVWAPSNY